MKIELGGPLDLGVLNYKLHKSLVQVVNSFNIINIITV